LKDQLEKDRRELFEKEKRLRELGGAVPVSYTKCFMSFFNAGKKPGKV
jgi:hypothetical protein